MTPEEPIPFDVDEADALEQRRPVTTTDEPAIPDRLPDVDADEADVLEQQLIVPDDDDRR